MSKTKKPLNQASLEDFKVNVLPGISNPRYEIFIYVPLDWIENPTEGLGISANFINQDNLKHLIFYSGSTRVEKISKTNILIGFEISEPYLPSIQAAAQEVPDEAELKLSATKPKE